MDVETAREVKSKSVWTDSPEILSGDTQNTSHTYPLRQGGQEQGKNIFLKNLIEIKTPEGSTCHVRVDLF